MRGERFVAVGSVLLLVAGSFLVAPVAAEGSVPDTVGLVDPSQGRWYLRNEAGEVTSFFFGNPGDFPFVGDWNCDGVDTPGLYRQSDGFAYLRNTNSQGVADISFFFGNPGDIPIAGDFDGDGCDTLSIYRPSLGRVFIINQLGADGGNLGNAELDYYFGNPGDKPFVGDFDGDGVDTLGLHRESTGLVYFRNSHTQGVADKQFFFGNPRDRLVAGDWGIVDGMDTPAVFRYSNTTLYFRHTNTQGNADSQFVWGCGGWLPVEGSFGLGSEGSTEIPPCPLEPATFESLRGINTVPDFTSSYVAHGLARWEQDVPGVEDIRITSTMDGAAQPALWVAPRGDRDRPLLVVLHSWSSHYDQHASIPFALWAQENGWALIAPQFRGRNDNAAALGSELAVQDVADAIDYATTQEGVDASRVYAVGLSGGGMMALLMAGRHPELVTAVAGWGPPYDLLAFYQQALSQGVHYADDLWRACGGDPTPAGPAQEECLRRSPMTYLDIAREQGVPVYIGQGIGDTVLQPSQGANAFNQLANPEDRFTPEEVEDFGRRRIPAHLAGSITTDTYFGEGDPTVVFARRSAAVWLVYFQSNHEMVYAPALRWFASDPR